MAEQAPSGKRTSAKAKEEAPREWQPTAAYVLALYQTRLQEGDEHKLRERIKLMRTLTEMEHQIAIPSTYRAITTEIRTPFTRDTWLRVTAALTRDTPVTHVEPLDKTEPARDAANLAERWTWGAFEGMNRDQRAQTDMIHESTKALVRDEESVLKVVHRPDAWAAFPERGKSEGAGAYLKRRESEKRRSRLPTAWRVVDRLSMLFGDGEFGDDWAIEYGEYPLPYLRDRYGMVEQDDSDAGRRRLVDPAHRLGGMPKPEAELQSAAGRCIKIEYWDAQWWAVVVDGAMAPGFPKRNPYHGRLPYFRAKADPVLFALSFLQPGLDALITMKLNWSYLGAYPSPKITTLPNVAGVPSLDIPGGDPGSAEEDQDQALVWKPGKAIDLPVGKDLSFLVPPPVGQDINEMIGIVRGLIDVAGVPSVFRGVGGSDQAGYAINQLIAAANLTYRKLGESLQRQFEAAGEFLWHIVRYSIRDEVPVLSSAGGDTEHPWLALKPDGRPTAYCAPVSLLGPLSVRFRPVLPTDEQARSMIAVQLVNAPKPLMSRRRAIEKFLQEEDPEGLLDEIAVEDALAESPLREMVIDQALREAGIHPPPPTSGLINPDGSPLVAAPPGPPTPSPYFPGQVSGQPSVPGLTQPVKPGNAPGQRSMTGGQGGRPAGMNPGRPGNQGG